VRCMCSEAETFVRAHPDTSVRQIRFTNFDQVTCDVFRAEFERGGATDNMAEPATASTARSEK
jgi:hypothetical protein